MRPHMPMMKVIINLTTTEITRVQNEPLWISEINLEYVYGQLKVSKGTTSQCNFGTAGVKTIRYYGFKKRSHGLSDIPTKL